MMMTAMMFLMMMLFLLMMHMMVKSQCDAPTRKTLGTNSNPARMPIAGELSVWARRWRHRNVMS